MNGRNAGRGSWPCSYELIAQGVRGTGERFPVTGSIVNIGRGKENDLVVRDARVSRQHVRLAWNGTGYTIQDLNSLNGTLVEGQRIAGPQALLNGDLIELAPGISLAFLARSYFSAS